MRYREIYPKRDWRDMVLPVVMWAMIACWAAIAIVPVFV